MFDLLGLTDALSTSMANAWYVPDYSDPPVLPGHSLAFMYRCERCDVTGRTDDEGNARCWLCLGRDVIEYRTLIKDQHSLSGGAWPVLPEPCERLVERSRVG